MSRLGTGSTGRPSLRSAPGAPERSGRRPDPSAGRSPSRTAERFAARVRADRRRRWATAAGALVVLSALAWLLLFSPYLRVDRLTVSGTQRVERAQVLDLARDQIGRPMALIDPADLAARVESLTLVRQARVTRSWPHRVNVRVTERTPVAALPVAGGGFRLVDADGVEVERVAEQPDGLPNLQIVLGAPGDPQATATLRAALEVLDGLPATLRTAVVRAGAASPDAVWLRLDRAQLARQGVPGVPVPGTASPEVSAGAGPASAGAKRASGTPILVTWGNAESGAEKARVLGLLIAANGDDALRYDVSAPGTPAVHR